MEKTRKLWEINIRIIQTSKIFIIIFYNSDIFILSENIILTNQIKGV